MTFLMKEGTKPLMEGVTIWLSMFDYVVLDTVPSTPTKLVETISKMHIPSNPKMLKTSHTASSSQTNSSIGQKILGCYKKTRKL